jgi:hypothetical protein
MREVLDMTVTRCLVAVMVPVMSLSSMPAVRAQSAPPPFGADVFIGGIPRPDAPKEGEEIPEFPGMGGWQVGASLRRGTRTQWLGWTGSYGSHANDDVRVRETLGGVRFTTPWVFGNSTAVRGFAHVLGGYAWSRPTIGDAQQAPTLVAGAGFDVFLFRLQVDYVRNNLAQVPRHSTRGFLAAVVPICFSGCRPDWEDGIPLKR